MQGDRVTTASQYIEERDGGYYVPGSRVSLDSIIQCFNEGLSPESIRNEFEVLTLAQVFGVIAWYLDNQCAVDTSHRLRRERGASFRVNETSMSPELRDRLTKARNLVSAATVTR